MKQKDEAKKMKLKWSCQLCGNSCRRLRINKSAKIVCWKCYNKDYPIMMIGKGNNRNKKSLQEVLSKIYQVNFCVSLKNGPHTWLSFPTCMIGKRFRIVLVDENGKDIIIENAMKGGKNETNI